MSQTTDHTALEEGAALTLDFGKLAGFGAAGLAVAPVVLQDADSREVLLIAFVNAEALRLTLAERRVVLWSTSRNELWRKGATSGDELELVEARVNCEQNSLLFLVRRRGHGACHTHDAQGRTRPTCYYRRIEGGATLENLIP